MEATTKSRLHSAAFHSSLLISLFISASTAKSQTSQGITKIVTDPQTGTTEAYTYSSKTFNNFRDIIFAKPSPPSSSNTPLAEALAQAYTTELGTSGGIGAMFKAKQVTSHGLDFSYWDLASQSVITAPIDQSDIGNGKNIVAVFISQSKLLPIVSSQNGTNNKTSNLGTTLLPQFEAGTLSVDQANKNITDNFTLDGSTTNAIDTQGNASTFSGVFSDASPGTPGNISFTNTAAPASITLTSANTYTGKTTVGQKVFLALRKGGSIADSQAVEIQRGGRLNIDNPNQTTIVRNITGQGDLQPNSTTNVVIDQPGIVFDGRLQTTRGSLIKSGSEAWTLTSTYNHVDGGITVAEGSFIMRGGSFEDTHTGVATPITVNPGARFGIQSNTTTNTGSISVGGAGSPSHLDINGTLNIKGNLNLNTGSRTLFNSNDLSDPNPASGARSLVVTGTLNHNGDSIESRGGNYTIDVGELRGNSNILIDSETLTLITRNNSYFDGQIGNFNISLKGGDLIKEGSGSLTLSQFGGIPNLNNLQINQGTLELLEQSNRVNTLTKISGNGALNLSRQNSSLSTPLLEIDPGGSLKGVGTIVGDVLNEGSISPGNSIGTLTVDGSYVQGLSNPNASLNIEVDGSGSDLLKINGNNRIVLLGGNLNISSYQGAPISAGKIYTAIDVTGTDSLGREIGMKTNLNVIGSSGFTFTRETDPLFATISPAAKAYHATCTSSDFNIQKNCTKLQFAWVENNPKTSRPLSRSGITSPGKSTIVAVKNTGGAITTASSGNSNANINTCISNGGATSTCQQQNKPGTGASGNNNNTVASAKAIDAGWASLSAAVTSGVTGGSQITNTVATQNGSTTVNTGYTTNQAKAALVTPDFVNVISALFAIPTRQQLNQALHSITAEPYASMQSVGLVAVEQFGKNSLALTDRAIPLTLTETFCKLDDGTRIPADSPERPDTCNERTKTVGSRWSLLLDGTNTEASLDGTNDLSSLDYNVFSTIYGLQYAFSPQWSAGAAFGYGQARLYNYEYANTHINSDTYSGSIWGIYRPSADWKISGLLAYMNLQYDSNRTMAFGGLNRTAEANWDGNGTLASLEAQYNWALNGNTTDPDAIRLKPRTFLSYANHQQGSFSESGAKSLNLAVDSHTADSLLWGIGFTLETPIRLNPTNRLIPRLTVGYEYDFMGDANEERELTASFSELPALGSVDVLGQNRGANALDVGLSIEIETSDSVSLYAGVNGGFWSNGTEVSYGGGLKYSW